MIQYHTKRPTCQSNFNQKSETYEHVVSLDDDEHVVNAEPEQEKGDKVVERTEAEPEGAAKTVRRHHGQHHGEEAHDGQVNLKKAKSS